MTWEKRVTREYMEAIYKLASRDKVTVRDTMQQLSMDPQPQSPSPIQLVNGDFEYAAAGYWIRYRLFTRPRRYIVFVALHKQGSS